MKKEKVHLLNDVKITEKVYDEIVSSFSLENEDGGILGIKDGVIQAFCFDKGNNQDVYELNIPKFEKTLELWEKDNIEFVGFIHSHVKGDDKPSFSDLLYLRKFLSANPELKMIHFPIVFKDSNKIKLTYYIFANNDFKKVDYLLIKPKKHMDFLEFYDFNGIYEWFFKNSQEKQELFVKISRKKPEKCDGILSYYDAVNAALCFGWIDSTLRNIDGVLIQRFSPRRKNSHWTELNINRCKELYKKGLMQESGIKVCPIKLEK